MTRRAWILLLGLVAFVVVTLSLVWWGNQQHVAGPPATGAPIKIGTISPLTGAGALYGKKLTQAVDLAFAEVNAEGGLLGRHLIGIHEDDQLEPRHAVSAAQKLINVDRVPVIIGAVASSSTLAVAPIAESAKVVLITPISSAVEISEAGDYIFRIAPPDSRLGRDAARWMREDGHQTAAVLYINNDYGAGLERVFQTEFTRLGGTVVASEAFAQGATDYRSQLTRVKTRSPDAVFVAAYMEEAGRLLRQRRELGISATVYGTDPFHDPLIFEGAGDAADGARFLDVATESGAAFESFAAKYKERYNMEADIIAAESYDAALAVIMAIRTASSVDPSEVKEALYRVRFEGASGYTEFDAKGDVPGKVFGRFEIRDQGYLSR